MSEIRCEICPHHCLIPEGKTGRCRARWNRDGVNVLANYGKLTGIAVDPVEKKPLKHFYPGAKILSVGSFGCNLSCPFCQNHPISMHGENEVRTVEYSPQELAELACRIPDNLGIAFTYNEPLISWEYLIETAELVKKEEKKIVAVTNGCVEPGTLEKILPYTDAMNIDLKGDEVFYRELGGDYETVRNTIREAAKSCHVEVTTLVVPGKNDSTDWIETQAEWLSEVNPEIVLHLSRYFPNYRYTIPPTEKEKLYEMKAAAEKHLKYVYLGNVW